MIKLLVFTLGKRKCRVYCIQTRLIMQSSRYMLFSTPTLTAMSSHLQVRRSLFSKRCCGTRHSHFIFGDDSPEPPEPKALLGCIVSCGRSQFSSQSIHVIYSINDVEHLCFNSIGAHNPFRLTNRSTSSDTVDSPSIGRVGSLGHTP